MYSTCLFCNGALGRNEAIEHFPVGRRLAFDAAKGRLWVVCASCKRWNLSPLETRWEAIEEAERAYRDTRTRVATEQIGLAKLKEGLELVRVGRPLLPEFAAWRYGDVFRRRLRRDHMWLATSVGVSVAGLGVFLAAGGNPAWGLVPITTNLGTAVLTTVRAHREVRHPRLRVLGNDGTEVRLSVRDAQTSDVVRHAFGGWSLRISHRVIEPAGPLLRRFGMRTRVAVGTDAFIEVEGDAALRAMTTLLPSISELVSGDKTVNGAVALLESSRRPLDDYLQSVDARGCAVVRGVATLALIPAPVRLALEMSLHEADERRFLEGELHELERRWREADEIAAIADNMFTTDATTARLDELKTRA